MSDRVTWIEIKKDEKNSTYCHRDCSMWYAKRDEVVNKYHVDDAITEVVNIYNYRTEKMEIVEFKTRDERIRWLDNPPFEYQYKPGTEVAPEDIGIPKEYSVLTPECWIYHEYYTDENGNRQERSGTWDELNKMRGIDIKLSDCEIYDPCDDLMSDEEYEKILPMLLPPEKQS